ncbi:hypothetical protein AMES_6067 [Amycolatopsis mediterranei S699]|uniref:Uncharacterized protein n=2 Tax=Amycolatopsis mediterranei TaxID=33910 RepID=A0A0H3DCF2_AMYMU|nr:hypothetical protein [Amycolatopsis mediterranei]ADJ47892.1 conserved hypothetical protein [Amycolatopsis mediterranei U32]AEK44785.1 hypothetical protein RAM_31550 [Amycolatopsis mediterranei S699]AFO79603.1 hypothetical protein AMES_6067 [Amycolatopsis mediterranei S699]AGT86731.1 hypothetical protein B737_6067 [Amycolatopsis mediterranei RB]KDO12403.1 hypothetical protein DV26_02530 [Amycolatopsis mediterranei]
MTTTAHPVASQTFTVLAEVSAERAHQDAKWGQQNHPDGTGPDVPLSIRRMLDAADAAFDARHQVESSAKAGTLTWLEILSEEFFGALAEDDPAALRAELVQVAATAVCWIEAIDRRARQTGRA